MAIDLTVEARASLQQTKITPNIIVEIDGYDVIFGAVKVTKLARIGEFVIGDGTLIGGVVVDEATKDYISFSGSTTKQITQKIDQDRGGGSSVTSFTIEFIDLNDELTEIFSPSVVVPDLLGREANIYYQTEGTRFPEDAARLFVGLITNVSFSAGAAIIRVDHPEQIKRQELLPQITGQLTAQLTAGQTSVDVTTTAGVLPSQENLTTYIRINDEIIKVGSIGANDFSGLERAQLGSVEGNHDAGDDYQTFYRLEGSTIELALRLLMSDPNNEAFATATATRINQLDSLTRIDNAVYFNEYNIEDRLGLTVGDFLSIGTGADPLNQTGYVQIIGFGTTPDGSYCIVNQTLPVDEVDLSCSVSFKSRFNVLNFGCGLKPYQCDVAQFEEIQTKYQTQLFDLDFFIKEQINAADFINEQILYVNSMYSLPRKGRVSCGISAPPILGFEPTTLNADNILNAKSAVISRSINSNFFNSIVYKINEDAVSDRFLGATITVSGDSFTRMPNLGNRALTIEAKGIRDTPANRAKIDSISRRFLDRYQFGAESISIETNFKSGFAIEVGDSVILDGGTIKLSDITQGSRNFLTRVMEVKNKSLNLVNGKCVIECLDVNSSTRLRFGVISCASKLSSSSTQNVLVLKRSFATQSFEIERDKWQDYLGQEIIVRSYDWDFIERVTIVDFDNQNPEAMVISPQLSQMPQEDWIIESPPYDESSAQIMQYWKALHCYLDPRVNITGSGLLDRFDVDPADVGKFFVGALVDVHSTNFEQRSRASVAAINGNTIELNQSFDFNIDAGFEVDLIGFGDEGSPYAIY